MSSSKIQEYNLDPNMGLAKETSVQEVLSAVESVESSVENIQTSVNSNVNKKYVCSPSNNVLGTVLNTATNGTNSTTAYARQQLLDFLDA